MDVTYLFINIQLLYIYIFFFSGYPQDQRQSYGIKVEQESFKSHKHA